MALSGQDIQELTNALISALDEPQLRAFVHASTGDRLYVEYVGQGKPLRPTIEDLLNALELKGTTGLFLHYVYVNKPGKPDVQQVIATKYPSALALKATPDKNSMSLSVQKGGVPKHDASTNAVTPGFQRNVRPYLPQLDVHIWLQRLLEIERRVCRVELAENALGTGFLVGPDTILTNWHVVKQSNEGGKINQLGCRFDFVRLPDGTNQPGQLVPLHAEGCIDSSPYSNAETTKTPETPPPTADELDYALLRLASAVGQQTVNGSQRGWITLPDNPAPLPENAPLLIVQHPQGDPMKLALDTQAVIGRVANERRLRYRTNTDPGSSGSPCFAMDWGIVALHHYGDPAWQTPLFNQGIPIELIRRRIVARGLQARLGA
jgi:hypothetical protein